MSRINLDLQASHKMLMLLDEANANAESVIDQIPGLFVVINENHEVLRANQGFIDLFGLDGEDLFRAPLSRFFRRESWKVFAHNIKQIIDAEDPRQVIRFEMGLATGAAEEKSERPFHWTLTQRTVKNQGEGRLLTVFGDDISGMREAERRLMKVFTSIPLGIFTLNRDGTIGDSYSSHLETMLDCGKLAGAAVEEVLFNPEIATMDDADRHGLDAIYACMGRSELEYAPFAKRFPQEIFHNTTADPKNGRWLKITYQPIVFNHIVEQLLIILEDRTAIVIAEKEMLEAAHNREKAIELERQSLALYESAIRDPLTDLYTRLYMKDAVAALLWEHDRDEIGDVSMVIFDIDHFKKINDTHGHPNGDRVLSAVAGIVLEHSGETDIPIRFGGEEFIVFTPADGPTALAFAERVRQAVEDMRFDLEGAALRATISGGVASHRRGESLDDFMHRADQLLYEAKRSGRNRNMLERRPPEESCEPAGQTSQSTATPAFLSAK
ncbi:sensor domain-containing diguanylate cyclase [Propionivibrio limicola]|uniref:sensor domain-containing diguanylate cyclase n=1 Tax=Propionivibrio limicola TaxID=167645 RepID=UPI0012913C47|nr:sensor domain-containing diguanylate cyclase [Propionivibrio limicola]